MLLDFPLGIIGVKTVSLDPELSSWRKYCCCAAVVISTIIMPGLIQLLMSAAQISLPMNVQISLPMKQQMNAVALWLLTVMSL